MKLKVLLPDEILIDEEVTRVIAEAVNGSFCLLPRHVDLVTALVPGLLEYHDLQGKEIHVAIDEGILVKCGGEVLVSTRNAVRGSDLGMLTLAVEEHFRIKDERERRARGAVARLEAGLVRRFMELEQHG